MTLPFEPPVVLAPMAGITNRAFRRLARESARAVTGADGGLYVSEMVTSRALVERNAESLDLVTFAADESPRAVQLYGVDPATIAAAVRLLVAELGEVVDDGVERARREVRELQEESPAPAQTAPMDPRRMAQIAITNSARNWFELNRRNRSRPPMTITD